MTVQTTKNDPINRGDGGHSELKNLIIKTWLGMRDSNPRSRDQNPVPYHLANPQYAIYCIINTIFFQMAPQIFANNHNTAILIS